MPDKFLQNVLYIDLTRRRFWVENRKDLFEKYLGGVGVATQLLLEECPKNIDPFDPENPIIFAVGPLTAVYPLASKTVAMFKSPHTGNLGESHAGGRSAVAIRSAGYGAIVIKGASETPVYLAIHESKVYFRDASILWGMWSTFTVGRIIRENEPGAGIRTIMRIGRAGERLVTYASVITETYRHFGRLGLGAVFGSKKLKAILVSGKHSIPVTDKKMYKELYDEIYDAAVKSPIMRKYHDLGTLANVLPLNELGALPTKNLKQSKFEYAEKISGESLAEHYLGRRIACSNCPVACIHLATLREPYIDEPYFYKTTWVSYDYEPLFALGSMLGGFNVLGSLKLLDEIDTQGLDAMSTGVTLAWATEAMEKGIITKDETLGLGLRWGDYETYRKAVTNIVKQSNEFYQALARGAEYAASKYGGKDFALTFGGNEMPGYHTGPAAYVGFLTGARHSHLDSAGYSYDQKMFKAQETPTPEKIADHLVKEESWRQILSSLVICFFARNIYKSEIVVKALKTMGYEFTVEDLNKLGREILKKKYEFKFREGFDPNKLRIPKRILETPTPHGKLAEEEIRKAVNLYFEKLK
ncbi:MAG: aldehyde ferredoxin oxidoreductase family protein [Candidatus Baldrarchaeia archaeon]